MGTSFLSLEATGAYIKLLCHQADKGFVTQQMIDSIAGQHWDDIKDKFIQNGSGHFFNERLADEVQRRKDFAESRRRNRLSKTSVEHMSNTSSRSVAHMENENENENVIESKKVMFEDFWISYDKKVDRKKAEKKFLKFPTKTCLEILEAVPRYVKSTPDKQFRKNPVTYLNNESWKNESIIPTTAKRLLKFNHAFEEEYSIQEWNSMISLNKFSPDTRKQIYSMYEFNKQTKTYKIRKELQ